MSRSGVSAPAVGRVVDGWLLFENGVLKIEESSGEINLMVRCWGGSGRFSALAVWCYPSGNRYLVVKSRTAQDSPMSKFVIALEQWAPQLSFGADPHGRKVEVPIEYIPVMDGPGLESSLWE